MKDLDKLIEEKTKELNNLVRQIRELRNKSQSLGIKATRLDGAISQLKELKNLPEDKEK